jgi:crotonobetaine/carnitine-CoA ligase
MAVDLTDVLAEVSGLSVQQLLTNRGETCPDRPFIHFGERTATYGEVHQAASGYGSALGGVGVQPGDLVALMMQNSHEYVNIYAALAYRGAPVVLINTAFRGYMLEYVLNDAGCRFLVADEEFLEVVFQSEARLESLERVLVSGSPDSERIKMWTDRFTGIEVIALGEVGPSAVVSAVASVNPGDMHCVVYSSGTTGPSKGIMISNAHALVKAIEVLRICDFSEADVLYSPLPLFYSMGLLRGVLSVALVRASIVLRDKFSASAYWEDVRAHGATVGHTVFSIPRMLESQPEQVTDRDHSLRCMFNARPDAEFARRFGVKLIESYGLTEGGNAIYNRLDEPARAGSCGRVSDEWEVRLADSVGEEVPVGETGEILIRPLLPNRIMLGYLNKAEVTVAAMRDLWFHTGDMASADADGFYFYQGRSKDMIRRRGQNISAWEVEQILLQHPDVADVAALAHPSDIGEDDLRVIVVSEAGRPIDLNALAGYAEERMPEFMIPRYFEVRPDLPRTPSGRIEKYRLAHEDLSQDHLDRGSGRKS